MLIAAALLLWGCGTVQARPQTAYRAYEGPLAPVDGSEATPTAAGAHRAFWEGGPTAAPKAKAPAPNPIRPTRRPKAPAVPRPKPNTGAGITGVATWYAYVPGQAAAASALRRAIGPHWRGTRVTVCAGGRCVGVVLTDYEASTVEGRLVDLDSRDFAALGALGRGVLRVTVRW